MSWPPTSASLMVPPPIDGVATERHIVKPRIQGTYTAELKESPSGLCHPRLARTGFNHQPVIMRMRTRSLRMK
jgi:hypothetical protein